MVLLKVRTCILIRGVGLDGGVGTGIKNAAQHLRINGILRHRPDRNIEITAEEDRIVLEKFIEGLKYGTGASKITKIEVTWEEATGEFIGFTER